MGGCGSDDDPPAGPTLNLVETLAEEGQFTTLITAVTAAGLVEVLSDGGPFTIFAPTDEAFDLVPPETLEFLLDPANQEALIFVLQYHGLEGEFFASDLQPGSNEAITLNGEPIEILNENGTVTINGTATVIETDLRATNGVIHIIDRVLIPPTL